MANTSISLVNLDFKEMKTSLKSYLKNQKQFKDYDFEGSNISVLLDVLALNTYHNAFYLNQVASEQHLDSAQIRDSVVSHAKDLNYVPRSFSSAVATVDITVRSTDANKTSITIPKGTKFSSRIENDTFTFSTNENIVVPGLYTFTASNVKIYEGIYLQETFTSDSQIILQNETLDTNSLVVTVIENGGADVYEYVAAKSLFGLDENSKVFFVQGAFQNRYEIVFGDGVVGRKPKDNSVILVEYRISNGELPNGAFNFRPMGPIDGETSISVTTVEAAGAGSVAESIESIKFNAPRHFTTQERGVTSEDYEHLLKENFSEVNAATAFGGEDLTPPVYGKVFVSVDLKDLDSLPKSIEQIFYRFLKARSPVSIDPVFVDPEYIYLKVNSTVKYNINKTALNENDLKTLVISTIVQYAQDNLNDFAKTLRYSRLGYEIDSSDESIISNETDITAYQAVTALELLSPTTLKFNFPITELTSSRFKYKGKESSIVNTSNIVSIVSGSSDVYPIGTVDFDTGTINLDSFEYDSIFDFIDIYVKPLHKDVSSTKNTILNIKDSDITITVERLNE